MSLFDQDFIINKGFNHLRHYVQRVACSVLLPISSPSQPPPPPPPTCTASLPPILSPAPPDMGTFPRRKDKSKSKDEDGPLSRKRGRTITGPVEETRSPLFSVSVVFM